MKYKSLIDRLRRLQIYAPGVNAAAANTIEELEENQQALLGWIKSRLAELLSKRDAALAEDPPRWLRAGGIAMQMDELENVASVFRSWMQDQEV